MTTTFAHYLTPFLASLHSLERPLTLDDYRRIHRVLSSRGQWTHQRMQQVLAALLTHSSVQQAAFIREYQQFFAVDPSGSSAIPMPDSKAMRRELAELLGYELDDEVVSDWQASMAAAAVINQPVPHPKPPLFRRLRLTGWRDKLLPLLLAVFVFLTVAGGGVYYLLHSTEAPEPVSPVAQTEPAVPVETLQEKLTVNPAPPSEPAITPPTTTEIDWDFLWWWLLPLSGAVVTAYALYRKRALEKIPEVMVALERPAGDGGAEQYLADPAATGERDNHWLDADTLDYCGGSVGFFLTQETGTALDVEATVNETIRCGGFPVVQLQRQRELFHLLILVDLANEAVYWNKLPYELAAGLRSRGIPVSLGYLQGSLAQINFDSGKATTLDELAEERERYSVLLFADAALLGSAAKRDVVDELVNWPQFAWLSFREQRHWSGAEQYLQQSDIAVWEAKAAHLPAVFRYLAGEMLHTRSLGLPAWPFQEQQLHKGELLTDYLARFLGDVLPLARIVALLPPPVSPALLVRMVREFAPRLSLFRLQRLFMLPGEVQGVGGVFWSVPVLKQLRGEFHRLNGAAEKQCVLTILLSWLAEAEPADKHSTAWLEWRFRYARLLGELDADAAWAMMAELETQGLPRARFTGLAADVLPMPEPASAQSLKTACQFGRRHGMPTVSLEQAFPEWFFWKRWVPVGAVLSGLLCCWAVYPTVQALLPVEVEVEKEVIAAPATSPESTVQTTLNIKLPEMSIIEGGTFKMGCVAGRDDMISGGCSYDEKPAHDVTVADFELSTHEVTVAQFRDFVAASGYTTSAETAGSCWSYDAKGSFDNVKGNYWQKTGYEQTDDHPVTCVSWVDAKAYLKWLNDQSEDNAKGEWRLPTEAEWEYAARGGAKASSAYSWGNEEPVCDLAASNGAQFSGCKERAPLQVGSFKQNKHPFGLFDMHGNAWEWVEDCWQGYDKTSAIQSQHI